MRHSTLCQRLLAVVVIALLFSVSSFAQGSKKSKPVSFGKASIKFNRGAFIKTWLMAGPFSVSEGNATPDEKNQLSFFDQDIIVPLAIVDSKPVGSFTYNGKPFQWRSFTSPTNIINLNDVYKDVDNAAVYALAEIISDSARTVLLGVGSDDGVKLWLNGKLVHKNWIGRPAEIDNDVVTVSLTKGSNTILLKVQDMTGDWGFVVRFLDKVASANKLVRAAGNGNLDELDALLKSGANPNDRSNAGITALDAARIQGRKEPQEKLLAAGAKDTAVPAPATIIDGIYSDTRNNKLSSAVAVLLAQDGKIIYNKAFGYADIKNKIPAAPNTKFRIGSITKQFTASAILRLQEQGKISIDDKLSKFIPDFPRGNEVTIHHLLTHTSGIHSFTGKPDFFTKVLKPVTKEELLAYFKNDPYDFNPGERYEYNNSGYFLLGYIIEKISGKTLGEYFNENFFVPLEMKNTGMYSNELKLEREAIGLTKEKGEYKNALNWDMSWAAGAGALYSTVEDLYKWNEAVFNGKVLNSKSLEAAFTSVKMNDGSEPASGKYGYGWGMGDYRGHSFIGHSGGLHGFISQLSRFTKDNVTVVILTNITPTEVELNPNKIAETLLWPTMNAQESFAEKAIGDVDLRQFVGSYDFKSNGAMMMVSTDGKNLFAQLSGQAKFPIFPSGKDEYFWKVVTAKIKFIRNEKGEVTFGHFEQGSFSVDAPKMPDVKTITLNPATLNDYLGKFEYEKDFLINIVTADGKLFAEAPGQPKLELAAVSENSFVVKEMNAKVEFVRDDNKKVTKIIVDISGQKKEAPRVE